MTNIFIFAIRLDCVKSFWHTFFKKLIFQACAKKLIGCCVKLNPIDIESFWHTFFQKVNSFKLLQRNSSGAVCLKTLSTLKVFGTPFFKKVCYSMTDTAQTFMRGVSSSFSDKVILVRVLSGSVRNSTVYTLISSPKGVLQCFEPQ